MRGTKVIGVAAAAMAITGGGVLAMTTTSQARPPVAVATLIDNTGVKVGSVQFRMSDNGTLVGNVRVRLPADSPEFHGMHVHANDAATGCVPGTGFTGVGGHWDIGGHTHGAHTGDLPSVERQSDGWVFDRFDVDKFAAVDLLGKALIIHAGPDNFGNIPLGVAANQYTDNGTAYNGTGGTAFTGNAGSRFACGVITAPS